MTAISPVQRSSRDRPLLVGGVVVAVVVVLAIIVVVAGGSHETLDPTSPEGTVQRFTQALLDGDTETAISLTNEADSCEPLDYRSILDDDVRVTLGEVRITGDRAVVEVTISYSSGDPIIDPYDYSDRSMFQLTKAEGEWRIQNAPWPFWTCVERP